MKLKRLALAACIAPCFVQPAMAQASEGSVQVYGKLYPYILTQTGSGATTAGTPVSTLQAAATGVNNLDTNNGISSGNSRIGLRGERNTGGGLKASFQLEGVVQVDNGSNEGKNFNFNRDNYVGLEGGFGAFKYGNLETIQKTYGDTLSFLGVSSGTFMSTSNILRRPGFGTKSDSRFHERFANSIQYETPSMAGVVVGLQYAIPGTTNEQEDSYATAKRKKVMSAGVKYDMGPIYLSMAHEIHYDFFGASNNTPGALSNTGNAASNSTDSATQFSVEYRISKEHKIGFDAIRKYYSETNGAAGRFDTYQNMAYQLAFESRLTEKVRLAGSYVRSDAGSCTRVGGTSCDTSGLEGSKYTLGVGYDLDSKTRLFAAASLLHQGTSASYQVVDIGSAKASVGEDIQQFAVGLAYSF